VIYILGDSHAGCTFAGVPGVEAVLVGSFYLQQMGLAHDTSLRESVGRLLLNPTDVVLFMFGEIDVRKRLKGRIALEGRSVAEILDSNVRAYLAAIESLELQGARRGVVSIIPPNRTREDNATAILPTCSDEERAEYTACLNRLLEAGSAAHGFIYVDIYAAYKDADGMLPLALSQIGGSHVADITKARAVLISMGLLP